MFLFHCWYTELSSLKFFKIRELIIFLMQLFTTFTIDYESKLSDSIHTCRNMNKILLFVQLIDMPQVVADEGYEKDLVQKNVSVVSIVGIAENSTDQ